MSGEYWTVAGESRDEFIERKSRFIGYIIPVQTEAQAIKYIEYMRKKYWDATHCVYAYVLRDGMTRRYSDDGEPQGTAGVPMLDVLIREGLTDVCVIGVRYFGGILLGGGGLVRAYGHTAKIAVDSATRLHMCESAHLQIRIPYQLYGKASNELGRRDVQLQPPQFSDTVLLDLYVKTQDEESILSFFTELTGGTAEVTRLENEFRNWN